MPTIDELAPVPAAADTDELPVFQGGVTRKVTRAQLLAGTEAQIALPRGTILGRSSAGVGSAETIAVGNYLSLASGTLSGVASPYSIGSSSSGLVPSASDLVPIGQAGTNAAVTYSRFFQGLTTLTNVDGSAMVVRPAGSTVGLTLSRLAGSMVGVQGGTFTGPLYLASDPSSPMQAATKQFTDQKVSRAGDTLTGPLLLAADPAAPSQAATKNYVDLHGNVPRLGFTMQGPITLAADPTAPLAAATKAYVDGRVVRAGDSMTGGLILSGDPTIAGQAATKSYVDAGDSRLLPVSGGSMTGPLMLAGAPSSPLHAATKQYTDTRLLRAGDTLTGYLTLSGQPASALHAVTKAYVDGSVASVLPLAGGTMSGPILLSGNPTTSAQPATKYYVDTGLAKTLSVQGGSLTGPLLLSGAPTQPLQAATRQYVDANPSAAGVVNVKLPPCGAKFDGVTDDTPAFVVAYQLASPGGTIQVPNGVTSLRPVSAWGVSASKSVKWIVDGTTLPDGTSLADAVADGSDLSRVYLPGTVSGLSGTTLSTSRAASQSTDFAVTHSSYSVSHVGGTGQPAIANVRTDTLVSGSPGNDIRASMDRIVWSGVHADAGGVGAVQTGKFVQAVRASATTVSPQPLLWAGQFELVDTTDQPSSVTNASGVLQTTWSGNGPDDASKRQIQSLLLAQHDVGGAPVEVSSALAIAVKPGSSGVVQKVVDVTLPFAGAVLDTTAATQLPGAAAIRLASGQSIAFEQSNTVSLSYAGSSSAILARYGSMACAVGRGISVSYGIVFNANATLAAGSAGCMVFLVGNGSYRITLPPASSVAPGTGFTFSAIGDGAVSILPSGSDVIDLAPITLFKFDRYHVISDGATLWREVFRANQVSPRFSAPPTLPGYTVANLPAGIPAGAKAFAADGRKPNEIQGSGSGVEVFFDGQHWISVCSGTAVAS